MTVRILQGDCREVLKTLPDESVHCVVTSPPYWGLRDYGVAGQLGLESTPQEYVGRMVEVFREVRRVLRADGTLWLNLGDSYASSPPGNKTLGVSGASTLNGVNDTSGRYRETLSAGHATKRNTVVAGLKPKDLVGIPWVVAKALQAPYYTGRIKSEADRAWLAGFVDGEGTISYVERDRGADHSPTHDVRVFVTNCDDVPLRHFSAITAGNVYQHDGERENRFGSRPCFRWQMGTHDGALLLRELFPYLRTKRKQAALVWTLFTTLRHQNGHARTPPDVIEKRRAIAVMVRSLNSGDQVDLPDWVEAPPSATEPGWYLRQDIIWSKPNPMPESVRDRCTKAHEYIFLLSKSERYYYDADAIAEDSVTLDVRKPYAPGQVDGRGDGHARGGGKPRTNGKHSRLDPKSPGHRMVENIARAREAGAEHDAPFGSKRNKRSVWEVNTQGYPEAHFATFPTALIEPCILAGCPEGGTVLDPFGGAGTTGLVADRFKRDAILIELNQEYAAMAERRIRGDAPLFAEVTA